MTKKHRLFFALEPDENVRREIQAVQRKLACSARMIPGEQIHITLAFLGQQAPEILPELCAIASRLHFEPCTLVLNRLGTFRRVNVLWLGVSEVPASLQEFRRTLMDELEKAGIGFDRKAWKPHLTLYRGLRNGPGIMDVDPVIWRLNQFSLIESISVKGGVEYCRQGHWKSGSSVN
jgi:2'-5' RNA ligase